MKRYHPFLVILHWVLAIMIIGGLIMGGKVLSQTSNELPEKVFYLKMHMTMGMIILILMVIRLVTRLFTQLPKHADIGNSMLNKLGVLTHYVFYIVVILVAFSGIGIAIDAGLRDIVFNGSGGELPADFSEIGARKAHGVLTKILGLVIIGHILAFMYHQFIRKDGLFSRMWFGKRQ